MLVKDLLELLTTYLDYTSIVRLKLTCTDNYNKLREVRTDLLYLQDKIYTTTDLLTFSRLQRRGFLRNYLQRCLAESNIIFLDYLNNCQPLTLHTIIANGNLTLIKRYIGNRQLSKVEYLTAVSTNKLEILKYLCYYESRLDVNTIELLYYTAIQNSNIEILNWLWLQYPTMLLNNLLFTLELQPPVLTWLAATVAPLNKDFYSYCLDNITVLKILDARNCPRSRNVCSKATSYYLAATLRYLRSIGVAWGDYKFKGLLTTEMYQCLQELNCPWNLDRWDLDHRDI